MDAYVINQKEYPMQIRGKTSENNENSNADAAERTPRAKLKV